MTNNNPIGIVTIYDDNNYGNRLQNYAVSSYLNKLGFDSVSLVPLQPKITKQAENAEKKALQIYREDPVKAQNDYPSTIRKIRFREFNEAYIKNKYCEYEKFKKEDAMNFSYVVTGSDQVWNPLFRKSLGQMENRLLAFAPPEKRVCFSPSFGVDDIPEKWYPFFEKELNKFRYLTCREASGARLVEKITGKKAHVVIDPTLMIEKEEWVSISKTIPGFNYDEKYILFYFLGDREIEMSDGVKEFLKNEAKDMKQYTLSDPQNGMMRSVGPAEFIGLINNASLVCTDSFHGTVFSILLNRPFIICDRKFEMHGELMDMSSRLNTLLCSLGLEGKLSGNDVYDENTWKPDYTETIRILEEKRQFQKELLMKQLDL